MAEGLAREGFDLDLRHGEAREDALVHLLLRSRVEVKSDGACRRTGNIFIEYRQKGKPSGIATTTASRWAIEYDDDHWLIVPTERLRALARKAVREGRTKDGGDGDQYRGALVPVGWFLEPTAQTVFSVPPVQPSEESTNGKPSDQGWSIADDGLPPFPTRGA